MSGWRCGDSCCLPRSSSKGISISLTGLVRNYLDCALFLLWFGMKGAPRLLLSTAFISTLGRPSEMWLTSECLASPSLVLPLARSSFKAKEGQSKPSRASWLWGCSNLDPPSASCLVLEVRCVMLIGRVAWAGARLALTF